MICQYCGGENVDTSAPGTDPGEARALDAIRSVYWRWYRGIGKPDTVIQFTDDLGVALGEYKGDGANG